MGIIHQSDHLEKKLTVDLICIFKIIDEANYISKCVTVIYIIFPFAVHSYLSCVLANL